MYQTLQQRLKKFQFFVEKWSNSSLPHASVGFQADQLSRDCDLDGRKISDVSGEGGASELMASSGSLMEQFEWLKEEWIEGQKQLEGVNLPQYGQALHTEMQKQFRLMEVDIIFLKTARQPKTITQRKRQLGDRLRQLIDYCETGIKLSQQKP